MKKPTVVLVDDDLDALESLGRTLAQECGEADFYLSNQIERAKNLVRQYNPSAAVVDLNIDPMIGPQSGLELISAIRTLAPECRIIVLTGHGGVDFGVRALRNGAASFIEKPADTAHLAALIRDGIEQCRIRRAYRDYKEQEQEALAAEITGTSRAIQKIREAVVYAAATKQAVLLTGETGSGKGLCARAIHKLGARRTQKFIRYQPTFSTADLVNSDLFGHVKGAFTGADKARRGLLAEADGGTLFLDEIAELPRETQVLLLGVLQEKRYRPVGSSREEGSEFRLISATNEDLNIALSNGRLRSDLYHRIAHFSITLPPLRERLEDLPPLAAQCLERIRRLEELPVINIEDVAIGKLAGYHWPGNVRELQAVIEGAAWRAHYHSRTEIQEEDLSFGDRSNTTAVGLHERVLRFKQQLVRESLARHAANQGQAARELGIDRSTLRRILAEEQ